MIIIGTGAGGGTLARHLAPQNPGHLIHRFACMGVGGRSPEA